MKKGLLFMALVVASAAGTLAADPQPQLLVHADGMYSIDTAPPRLSGDYNAGGEAGLEFLPATILNQTLGVDLDYNYLTVGGKSAKTVADNDFTLSLRVITPKWGMTSAWLQGGIGFTEFPNDVNGTYLAFVEPGVRVVLAPRLAVDAGIQYRETTPKSAFVQSLGVTLGVTVPLDGSFTN